MALIECVQSVSSGYIALADPLVTKIRFAKCLAWLLSIRDM